MIPYVEVQFTGNPKLYGYLIPVTYLPSEVSPKDRIVVINKIKDGVPSLSIATVVSVGECNDETANMLAPFVQLIPKAIIDTAVVAVARLPGAVA